MRPIVSQFQHVRLGVQRPDAREGGIEVFHQHAMAGLGGRSPLVFVAPRHRHAVGPRSRLRRERSARPGRQLDRPLYSFNGYGVNYLHVIQYGPGYATGKTMGPKRLAALFRPAETIMIADGQGAKDWTAGMG
jgi:hypothetical protein